MGTLRADFLSSYDPQGVPTPAVNRLAEDGVLFTRVMAAAPWDLYRDSLIVFTSDHGEEFWEHGKSGHGHTLYDEVMHVPLILKLPQSIPARTIDTLVVNSRLMPTILDLYEIPYSGENLSYRSLRPLWERRGNDSSAEPVYSTGLHYYEDRESIVFDRMKYVRHSLTRREELYDLIQDPQKQFSIVRSNPEKVEQAKPL